MHVSREIQVRPQDLFAVHQDALLVLARKLCGDLEEARDLVQDTFERALGCAERFIPGTNLGAWLVTILRRLFIDGYRRRKRRAIHEPLENAEQIASLPRAEPPRWEEIEPDELDRALEDLEEPFRSVFVMHAIEGRSYAEIASRLEIPKNTVGTRMSRARSKLKRSLAESRGAAIVSRAGSGDHRGV